MYRSFLISLFSLFLLVLANSCNEKPEVNGYGELFEKVILTKEGNFRGVNIGETIDVVKSKEKGKLIEEETDYLYYDVQLDTNDFYNLAYYFDESGLYEMMLDATFDKKAKADELFKTFNDFYSKQYGEPKMQEGYLIWETQSPVSNQIEIALVNNSEGNENGYISLIISNYDY